MGKLQNDNLSNALTGMDRAVGITDIRYSLAFHEIEPGVKS
jgi:hypothetical protein